MYVTTVPSCAHLYTGERVLCLDGGGIRSLVQLEIFRHIEEMTGRRIMDLFDWIVGASIGGILALAMVYGEGSHTYTNVNCDIAME